MKRTTTAAAIFAAAALTLTACGGGGESSNDAAGDPGNTPAESGRCTEDKVGGTITMGEYSMLPTFAPGQGQYGVRGAAESAAVFDRLMRWNNATEEFEPKLAESLESNDDNSVWTLKLRDGVKFSNGDPLTAEDVAFTIDQHKDPATRAVTLTDAIQVKDTRVVDPLTVEFTLTEPWTGFPILLAGAAGEVLPQKAYTEAGPEKWAQNPIGAGAYLVDTYTPNQEVVLKPNPDYYGGPVCPTLRFIRIPGGQGTLESFQNGEIQAGFLRGAKFVSAARDADEQGFYEITSSGSVVNMNSGAAGYDGVLTDARARQAVGFALDRDLMNQRLTGGKGQATSALLAESSRFFDGEQGPQYDVEKAKQLVEELKAERPDWNGKLTLLAADSPESVESGVVLKALLDAAGFDVTIENAPVSQVTARQFTGDYEIVIGGLATSEADPSSAFASNLLPEGMSNITGINDPRFVKAISDIKASQSIDDQKAAYKKFQEIHNEILPFTVIANAEEYVVIDESLKGVVPSLSSTMLFDGAYLEK
ncbi:ABC transporter substrate-binding protein [Dietzia sp. ANT_WB102]|uniref:ABC transporter substrate-binding protein n=1 Tax=Dietzia sp. ANT_WB102 TaxID=2597345 RepID=UPI0011EEF730|nr:ABC transporter substrate-binding protein [Dietzia sp. ANT_WB102]KAA0918971.1 ABC transporter substrate-binding protein [Dietzia sp. ANT_WB102]